MDQQDWSSAYGVFWMLVYWSAAMEANRLVISKTSIWCVLDAGILVYWSAALEDDNEDYHGN